MNIWAFTEPLAARERLLRAGIRRLDPDLLAFQEAGFSKERHQVAEMLDGLGYHVLHQFEHSPSLGQVEGNCVASRWSMKLVEVRSLRLTRHSRNFPCAALAVKVAVPEPVGPLLFVNAKPSWEFHRERERELQAVALAKLVERHSDPGGFPPIVAGDFDATPDSSSIRFLTGKQSLDGISVYFADAWQDGGDGTAGNTWSHENRVALRAVMDRMRLGRKHARRIDYIFLCQPGEFRRYARVRRCRVELNQPHRGVWPSDHYAVYAEIDVVP